ncbi:uncharacterized protein E5676_scaffold129G00480 [Cucumis melo var. makuwa]|uniref:Uncharacterized protein n=1 Tax=Cucumis melo var. makuwa TaxID=1194695 RepID=A0A5D3E1E8_CUCMM|nr:uncharacterized protein E6C27_scaffold110G001630 [Cucumis melo var. makuwa]TYK29340.1 uncharacterized protein E5676_scaffold129G00480 [Cucumis melo var. makuwa]
MSASVEPSARAQKQHCSIPNFMLLPLLPLNLSPLPIQALPRRFSHSRKLGVSMSSVARANSAKAKASLEGRGLTKHGGKIYKGSHKKDIVTWTPCPNMDTLSLQSSLGRQQRPMLYYWTRSAGNPKWATNRSGN